MNDSEFVSKSVEPRAIGYSKGREKSIFHPSAFFGCGDIISTTRDLKKFISSLNKGEIIGIDLVEEMKEISIKSKFGNYGYGLMITEKLGEKGVGHGGSVPNSFSSQISYYTDSDCTIIVLCNDIRSIKPFIPGVMVSQYMERCLYEKISCKKINTIDKVIF